MTTTATLTCGHAPTRDGSAASRIGTGYATDPTTGATYCYPCSDDRERAAMATARTFVAYVNAAGDLTTWPGGILARGIKYMHGISRSGWHGSEVHSWRFIAPDGSEWYGRNGGTGRVIAVRRAKTSD